MLRLGTHYPCSQACSRAVVVTSVIPGVRKQGDAVLVAKGRIAGPHKSTRRPKRLTCSSSVFARLGLVSSRQTTPRATSAAVGRTNCVLATRHNNYDETMYRPDGGETIRSSLVSATSDFRHAVSCLGSIVTIARFELDAWD